MEPTANYHKPLVVVFDSSRTPCLVLVSGVTAKRNRESWDGRWDKHDVKDSANVADLISQGKCLYYDFPTASLRGLRNLLSFKKVAQETRAELSRKDTESSRLRSTIRRWTGSMRDWGQRG